jgi:hypothetical protein
MSRRSCTRRSDLEAARCADVLEVDAAERRREAADRVDELVEVPGVQCDRDGVEAAELLEQQRLALHHRQRGLGTDVAEAEHRGAVGDDRDGVGLPRVLVDQVRLFSDGGADAGDPRRVGQRQVLARLQRYGRDDLDLAAAVQQEDGIDITIDSHGAAPRGGTGRAAPDEPAGGPEAGPRGGHPSTEQSRRAPLSEPGRPPP